MLEFDSTREVRGLTIRNGYNKNADIYGENSRVKDVEVRFSTGDTMQATLDDKPGTQYVGLNRPLKAKWVELIIRSVYPGWKYSDTANRRHGARASPAPPHAPARYSALGRGRNAESFRIFARR